MPASPSTLPSRSPTAPGSRGGASGLGSRTSGSATKSTVSRLARPRTPVRTPTSGARRAGASGAAESPGSKAEAEEQQPSGPAVELEALARKNGVLVERLHTLREVRASELSAEELRGVVALVDASASLERLSIMCTDASEAEAAALATALRTNKTLRSLYLSYNTLADGAAVELCSALAANTGLHSLYMRHTDLCSASTVALAKALGENLTLQTLALSLAPGVEEGAALALAEALGGNRGLRSLEIRELALPDPSALLHALAAALRKNRTLHSLSIPVGEARCDGIGALRAAMLTSSSLRRLALGLGGSRVRHWAPPSDQSTAAELRASALHWADAVDEISPISRLSLAAEIAGGAHGLSERARVRFGVEAAIACDARAAALRAAGDPHSAAGVAQAGRMVQLGLCSLLDEKYGRAAESQLAGAGAARGAAAAAAGSGGGVRTEDRPAPGGAERSKPAGRALGTAALAAASGQHAGPRALLVAHARALERAVEHGCPVLLTLPAVQRAHALALQGAGGTLARALGAEPSVLSPLQATALLASALAAQPIVWAILVLVPPLDPASARPPLGAAVGARGVMRRFTGAVLWSLDPWLRLCAHAASTCALVGLCAALPHLPLARAWAGADADAPARRLLGGVGGGDSDGAGLGASAGSAAPPGAASDSVLAAALHEAPGLSAEDARLLLAAACTALGAVLVELDTLVTDLGAWRAPRAALRTYASNELRAIGGAGVLCACAGVGAHVAAAVGVPLGAAGGCAHVCLSAAVLCLGLRLLQLALLSPLLAPYLLLSLRMCADVAATAALALPTALGCVVALRVLLAGSSALGAVSRAADAEPHSAYAAAPSPKERGPRAQQPAGARHASHGSARSGAAGARQACAGAAAGADESCDPTAGEGGGASEAVGGAGVSGQPQPGPAPRASPADPSGRPAAEPAPGPSQPRQPRAAAAAEAVASPEASPRGAGRPPAPAVESQADILASFAQAKVLSTQFTQLVDMIATAAISSAVGGGGGAAAAATLAGMPRQAAAAAAPGGREWAAQCGGASCGELSTWRDLDASAPPPAATAASASSASWALAAAYACVGAVLLLNMAVGAIARTFDSHAESLEAAAVLARARLIHASARLPVAPPPLNLLGLPVTVAMWLARAAGDWLTAQRRVDRAWLGGAEGARWAGGAAQGSPTARRAGGSADRSAEEPGGGDPGADGDAFTATLSPSAAGAHGVGAGADDERDAPPLTRADAARADAVRARATSLAAEYIRSHLAEAELGERWRRSLSQRVSGLGLLVEQQASDTRARHAALEARLLRLEQALEKAPWLAKPKEEGATKSPQTAKGTVVRTGTRATTPGARVRPTPGSSGARARYLDPPTPRSRASTPGARVMR